MRAESEVVREIPMALVSRPTGMVSAISAPRSPMSEGRTRPVTAASRQMSSGVSAPAKARTIKVAATDAYTARIPASRVRWPMRSLATPSIGAIKVPPYCMAPNTVSSSTEPVSTSTTQPRISVSISNAQEVSRSAGHWNRKLRIRKGASVGRLGMCKRGGGYLR